MTFNVSKCKYMLVSRRRNTVCPPINLNLNDHQLENVQTYNIWGYCYLLTSIGLTILKAPVPKLQKLLGLLYGQFSNNTDPQVMAKLYLSLVKPHLEYGAQVWHPYTAKIHTHWRKFSSLDYGSVWGTGIQATKTYRYLSVTFIFCHCQHFLRLSIIFPVNFHPTPLSSYLSEMNPSVAVIDSLASFPFISSANVSGLKAEFPLYAAGAALWRHRPIIWPTSFLEKAWKWLTKLE